VGEVFAHRYLPPYRLSLFLSFGFTWKMNTWNSQLATNMLLHTFWNDKPMWKPFSEFISIKPKYHNSLQLQSGLQDAVLVIHSRISNLVTNMHAHLCHRISTTCHFYSLLVGVSEYHMISLGWHGENSESKLVGNKYKMCVGHKPALCAEKGQIS
jgi:hypothetical protein